MLLPSPSHVLCGIYYNANSCSANSLYLTHGSMLCLLENVALQAFNGYWCFLYLLTDQCFDACCNTNRYALLWHALWCRVRSCPMDDSMAWYDTSYIFTAIINEIVCVYLTLCPGESLIMATGKSLLDDNALMTSWRKWCCSHTSGKQLALCSLSSTCNSRPGVPKMSQNFSHFGIRKLPKYPEHHKKIGSMVQWTNPSVYFTPVHSGHSHTQQKSWIPPCYRDWYHALTDTATAHLKVIPNFSCMHFRFAPQLEGDITTRITCSYHCLWDLLRRWRRHSNKWQI